MTRMRGPAANPGTDNDRRDLFLAALEYGVHPLVRPDDEHHTHSVDTPTTPRESTP